MLYVANSGPGSSVYLTGNHIQVDGGGNVVYIPYICNQGSGQNTGQIFSKGNNFGVTAITHKLSGGSNPSYIYLDNVVRIPFRLGAIADTDGEVSIIGLKGATDTGMGLRYDYPVRVKYIEAFGTGTTGLSLAVQSYIDNAAGPLATLTGNTGTPNVRNKSSIGITSNAASADIVVTAKVTGTGSFTNVSGYLEIDSIKN